MKGEKQRSFKITNESMYHLSGYLLMISGAIYMIVQLIHPDGQLENAGTRMWFTVALLSMVMSLFSVIGLVGIYIRQVKESGVLGLLGVLLTGLFWLLSMTFAFIEAFVLPLIASSSPEFVSGMMGLFDAAPSEAHLGVFPLIVGIAGFLYVFGGFVFGFATARARVFPKAPAMTFAFAALFTVFASFVPYPGNRIFAVPMAFALCWLGWVQVFMKPEQKKI